MPLKTTYTLHGIPSLACCIAVEEAASYSRLQNTLDDALRVCENATHALANLRCGRGGHHVWVSYRRPDGEWTRVVMVEEPAPPLNNVDLMHPAGAVQVE